MRGARLAGVLALVLLVLTGAAWAVRSRRLPASIIPTLVHSAPVERAPEGVRIRVQVLNTTKIRGLARRATQLLRDRGFDVVEIGTTSALRDTTLVLDRSGHPDWAALAAQVMSPARAESRPDSSRYLDVTVLVGRLWRPPAKPLYP